MKYTTIALAVAATLATGSAMAAAVTKGDIATARSSSALTEVWFAGASASALPAFLAFEKLCDAGTTSIWTDATSGAKPGSIGNYAAYACKQAGVVTVLYTNNEGSATAYAPFVATTNAYYQATLKRLPALDTATCTTNTTYTHTELVGGTTVATPVNSSCTAAISVAPTSTVVGPKLPDAGFTDVEASTWGIDASAIGTESDANLGQAFGIAVSTNLYRALQVAQGIAETGTNFDPAKAPSITKAQYGAIAQGNPNSYQTTWANLIPGDTTHSVYLTRRVNASGTQSSSNIFFLGNPCNNGNAGQVLPKASGQAKNVDASFNGGKFHVYEASGTGDVKKWLTTQNLAGQYAIGVVSLENDWRTETAANSSDYRFVKIDGVSPEGDVSTGNITSAFFGTQPTLAARSTAVNGSYPFHMEMKYFVPNSATTAGSDLMANMVSALADPNVCTLVPRGITLNAASGTGCLGSSANVVVKVTKGGNNCSLPMFY